MRQPARADGNVTAEPDDPDYQSRIAATLANAVLAVARGGPPTVIPRYQKILFAVLLVAALAMGGVLWHLRQRAHQRLLSGEDSAPTRAPEVAPAEQATLVVANDTDGSLLTQERSLPLPADAGARARVVLGKLLDLYADPGASTSCFRRSRRHRTGLSAARARTRGPPESRCRTRGRQPYRDFAASHPSGLETETLTVLSICATLRANLPQITEVRFLVDGQQRANLAGHADLTRTYLTADAVPTGGASPVSNNAVSANPPRIGVFDSGFGGLTVLRALVSRLPHAQLCLHRRYGPPALRLKIAPHHRALCG